MKTLIAGPKLDALLKVAAQIIADGVPGAFAECGVYQGGSLRALAETARERRVYGFDTFQGLPQECWREGEPHKVGDFGDSSLDVARAAVLGLSNVRLIPGLFPESADAAEIEGPFALVHIDFDFYASTAAAIAWFRPRMSPGGVMVFDDYDWKHCPGVRQAIEEAGLSVEVTAPCQAMHRVAA